VVRLQYISKVLHIPCVQYIVLFFTLSIPKKSIFV
jgi:hypothetical protein